MPATVANNEPRRLLTVAQTAARAHISRQAFEKYMRRGIVSPDFSAGERFSLFDPDRLQEIVAAIERERARNWKHLPIN